MRKFLGAAFALCVTAASPAAAAGPFGDYCTSVGGSVNVCTSVSTTFFSNAMGNYMQVEIRNLEMPDGPSLPHRITGIALYSEGQGAGTATFLSGPTAAWQGGADNSFFGSGNGNSPGAGYSLFAASMVGNGQGGLYGCTQVGNARGTSTCSAPGVFLFELGAGVTVPTELHFAFRSQSISGGDKSSAKCYSTTAQGQGEHACWNTTPPELPPTVTPEPATVALLASGLLVLGGVGIARRRRDAPGA